MSDGDQRHDMPVAERFRAALDAGRLDLPYCHRCRRFIWYPRSFCSTCGSRDLTWENLSGQGTLHSYTSLHGTAGDTTVVQRVIGYVDLQEGPRVLCLLTGRTPPTIDASVRFHAAASVERAALCFTSDSL